MVTNSLGITSDQEQQTLERDWTELLQTGNGETSSRQAL